ncbi:MAG: hypothetical protein M3335_05685 [Actinomycetota bacterium]|nr:hypothetical protein [Actinomycetota bacterium]
MAAFMAFAVLPATASATNDPDLTHPTGTLAKTGKNNIRAKNVGVLLMTDANTGTLVECTTAHMTGDLEKNTGSLVEGSIRTATFSGTGPTYQGEPECTSTNLGGLTVTPSTATNGLPWCLRSTNTMATDEFQVRGNECGAAERPIRFAFDTTLFVTCVYERTTPIPGTFKTHPEDAVLSVSHVEFKRVSGFGCPEQGFLDMSFTLETNVAGTNPLYVS